ncbi:hypothetical protein N7G274_001146 [Stereocaulon virgatum]|uniref:NTF2-like protein n=1 Tax=Stereocaulon virgatum TaxID=373712 RepID=A0ABR4AN09_9LECA
MCDEQPPIKVSTSQSDEDKSNIAVVLDYMSTAYSPRNNKCRSSVSHLCTSDSTFTPPTTFLTCHTPLDYANSHAHVLSAIADLHIASYDIVFAEGGHLQLRYSAEGSHCGELHNGIEPSGRKAKWTAAAIFEVKDGKIYNFTKEWDELNVWKQLGWMNGDEYT